MDKKRYVSLDFIKGICAIMVIILHVPIQGNIGEKISVLSRIAVPVFLLISGFIFSMKNTDGNNITTDIKKQLINIIKISFLSFALYFIFNLIFQSNKIEYMLSIFSLNNIIRLVFFNEPSVAGHLWYLFAYIYVLTIFLLLYRNKKEKYMYIFAPIGILLYLILGKYSIIIFNNEFNYLFVRNFLFMGLPYFSIGYFIGINNLYKVKNKFIYPIILFFILFTLAENSILNYYNVNTKSNNYLGNTFLAISIFIFIINNNNLGNGTLINRIGRKYSLYIYILHPLINTILLIIISFIDSKLPLNYFYKAYMYIGWIVVLLITTIISSIYYKFKTEKFYINIKLDKVKRIAK